MADTQGFFFPDNTPEQAQLLRQQLFAKQLIDGGQSDQATGAYGGLANAGKMLAGALLSRQLGDKQKELETTREGSYSKALGNFLSPFNYGGAPNTDTGIPDNVNVSPQASSANAGQLGSSMGSRLAATGNTDLQRQVGPELAKQMMQASAPITPFQRAQLDETAMTHSPDYLGRVAGAEANARAGAPISPYQQAEIDAAKGRDAETARTHTPEYQGAVAGAESDAKFSNEAKLAKIKADISAQTAGEFGRSMNGKAYNILAGGLTNDAARGTPEYATAWQILSNPRIDPNTGTVVTPDLSAFKPPTSGAPGGAPAQPGQQPGAPPPQRMPSVQAFAPPNPSQPEAASAGYANRLSSSADIIDKNQGEGTSMYNRGASSLPGGNYLVSGGYQQLDQAERNFVNAQLRRESGAAISESEFGNARRQYLPQPGDGPEVLKQKKAARDMAVRNMQLSAGNVLMPPGVIQQSSPAKGSPVVPMEQGFGAAPQAVPKSGADPQAIVDELRRRGVIK